MKKKAIIQLLIYAILIIFAVLFTLPMLYLITTALKPNGALYDFPPRFFPELKTITLENFTYIINEGNFYLNFINSTIVSIITVAIAAIVSSALGFCIGRFQFVGRNLLFSFIMLTMIIPGMTLIVPQYELAVKMKVINHLFGLIPFYVAWVIPYSTFMLKGFVENIPREFDEAVFMDGGSIITVFGRIILPIAKPGIASISIFNFLTAWEEFPWANTVINDNAKRTLPIAISGFFGQHQFTEWGYVFALSTLSLVPILIVFISCQRYFVAGITTGGVKG